MLKRALKGLTGSCQVRHTFFLQKAALNDKTTEAMEGIDFG